VQYSTVTKEPERDEQAEILKALALEMVLKVHRKARHGLRINLQSSLDRDLSFDSLARIEFLLQIERTFMVKLPEETLQKAETLGQILEALQAIRDIDGSMPMNARRDKSIVLPSEGRSEPTGAGTLLEALDWHVRADPNRTQIIYTSESAEERISYGTLKSRAEAVAAGLQQEGLRARQTVAIMMPTSPEYFYAYFGILLAGGIPVPIYPPARLSQIEDHVRRHTGILNNAQCTVLITVPEAMSVARLLEASVPGLRKVTTAETLMSRREELIRVPVQTSDIAFIQYTSGSTGNPKGVVLTHANLLANIRAIGSAVHILPEDVFISWLPLYHDMGLISTWLASLYFCNPFVVMSPLDFLSRPERWLWAIHRYRGSLTAAPNFAYELCLKRIDDERLFGLDLSSVRVMANGAEPVSPETMERFSRRFSPYGFNPQAMSAVYGLAEATVGLLVPAVGRGPLIDSIQRDPFVRYRKALPARPDDPNPLRFPACGRPLPGHEVRIVDETGLEVGERVEGHLEFKGPSATSGYYNNPEETKKLIRDGWLNSGDRAYTAEGEVYITGRVKDIIIRAGRNIYPHELENAVGALAGVRKGCVAVFGSPDPNSGTERLIVLAETNLNKGEEREALKEAIFRKTVEVLGEPPDEVMLAPIHTVLKTSSGKIRRSASRELYESGLIGGRSQGVWRQVIRLSWQAALAKGRRWLTVGREFLYAAYFWTLLTPIALVTWLFTVIFSGATGGGWTINRLASRLFLKLSGIPFQIRGLEHVPVHQPHILVANHASYLDGLILFAALPGPYRFVVKKEIQQNFWAALYLRRLGVEFVERFIVQQSLEDVERMAAEIGRGHSLAFFPEGTFLRMTGLLPFHLGAFVLAMKGNLPVLPVALRGTRALLRDTQWFPRRGPIEVTISKPILPPQDESDVFSGAIRMRDEARTEILRHCGEPDEGSY